MTVFIVFGGYYANASNVPKGLRWIAHTSLIKYSFEAFCVNEFRGLTFVNDKPGRVGSESGEEVRPHSCFAASLGMQPKEVLCAHGSTNSGIGGVFHSASSMCRLMKGLPYFKALSPSGRSTASPCCQICIRSSFVCNESDYLPNKFWCVGAGQAIVWKQLSQQVCQGTQQGHAVQLLADILCAESKETQISTYEAASCCRGCKYRSKCKLIRHKCSVMVIIKPDTLDAIVITLS
jgi:hypothetical protein